MYVIELVVEEDMGNYICIVYNFVGNFSGIVDIYVQCEINEYFLYFFVIY